MFLVFEGGEACGKTTQIKLLERHFKDLNKDVLVTREPGGTPFAESLRSLFKSEAACGDTPLALTELYVVMAARHQHIQKVILPALAAGKIVLCDRFLDSTYVYQGHLGGLPRSTIDRIALPCVGSLKPTLTLVLDVAANVSSERIRKRSAHLQGPADRYDNSTLEGLEKLRNGFALLVNNSWPYPDGTVPNRILISTQESLELTQKAILKIIGNCL
jgi:dTMP kinase